MKRLLFYRNYEDTFGFILEKYNIKANDTIFSPGPKWDDEIKRYYVEM